MNPLRKHIIIPLLNYFGRKKENRKFSKPPIFIVACPRSGTTMLLSILSAHPNIHIIKKQTYAFDKWKKSEGKEIPARVDRLYLELLLNRIKPAATRWCEKTPKHSESIGKILNYLPDSKIISLVRDGRDIVTSKHPYHDSDNYWVRSERWIHYVSDELSFCDHPNVHIVKYEDIVTNYAETIGSILSFLEEDYTEEMEDWYKNSSLRNSIHLKEGIQQLHTKSIGRWKNPEHREVVENLLNNAEAVALLKQLNYME